VVPLPLLWLDCRDGGLVSLNDSPIRCVTIIREHIFSYHIVDNLTILLHNGGGYSLMNPLVATSIK
jgi:hypothetical protein